MSDWDGNINSPHTMQDEYELARSLGTVALTTADDGQMIAAREDLDVCPQCDGSGSFWDDQTGQPDEPQGGRFLTCWACKGEGRVDTSPCIACGGRVYDHDEGCPLDGALPLCERSDDE